MSSKQTFPCNTCELVLDNSQAQISHMREPWHVYNLKRRLASLPPISADEYSKTNAASIVLNKQEPSTAKKEFQKQVRADSYLGEDETQVTQQSAASGVPSEEEDAPRCCLFCTETSNDLETCLQHMSMQHDFHIPEIESLSSLESLLKYLRTVIKDYHECLYCGVTKDTSVGIQRHMLDKGHCLLNLKREPELLEFWELSGAEDSSSGDEEASYDSSHHEVGASIPSRMFSESEYTLPSGKVVASKSKAREARRNARRSAAKARGNSYRENVSSIGGTDVVTSSHPSELVRAETKSAQTDSQGRPQDLTVSRRDAVGLVGLSNQQIRSLVTVQRKMQRQEAAVRASAAWADELGGRSQKHGKVKMDLRSG